MAPGPRQFMQYLSDVLETLENIFLKKEKRDKRDVRYAYNFMGKINIHTLFKSGVMLHHSKMHIC